MTNITQKIADTTDNDRCDQYNKIHTAIANRYDREMAIQLINDRYDQYNKIHTAIASTRYTFHDIATISVIAPVIFP